MFVQELVVITANDTRYDGESRGYSHWNGGIIALRSPGNTDRFKIWAQDDTTYRIDDFDDTGGTGRWVSEKSDFGGTGLHRSSDKDRFQFRKA